jgi:gluconate 2-dehydrogenase gamma chain
MTWTVLQGSGGFFAASKISVEAVGALLEGIIPGTLDAPGAKDAAAVQYVDRLLSAPDIYYEIPRWRELYQQGVPQIVAAVRVRFNGKTIEELAPTELEIVLRDLSQGTFPGFTSWAAGQAAPDLQKEFFAVLRAHAIEGCFADPRWGGNQNGVMWHWLGYPNGPAQQFRRS